jgi:Quinohemoprotein amine dehydrogenase A, alpha subunit, haem binding
MTRLGVFGAAAALALVATTQINAQGALPQGEGRDIVAVACTQRHALAPILAGREGPAGWKRHVHNMVLRGAQLSPSESETVIRYLAANFGPGAAPPGKVAVTLPTGAGKELVETRCTLCHDLERVAVVKRPRQHWPAIVANMVARGATATPEEAGTIATYLAAQFGSD